MNLDEIIEYENENTSLDFKAAHYPKDKWEYLLKDIVAMANADVVGERLIVIGVKHYPDGNRDVVGLDDFTDEAVFQQLVNDNIEPEVNFIYSIVEYKSYKIGVFKLFNCDNQPYMLKKDYGKLKRGDSFVRKGSFQTKLVRRDIDRMFSQRFYSESFVHNLSIDIECNEQVSCTQFLVSRDFELPSTEAEIRIRQAIFNKENPSPFTPKGMEKIMQDINRIQSMFNSSYEYRDIEMLKENLANVKEDYKEDDLHQMFEQQAHKVNLVITNQGDKYIEDASVEIVFVSGHRFDIASEIHRSPYYEGSLGLPAIPTPLTWEERNYPVVKKIENGFRVTQDIGDVKHLIEQYAFKVPVRIFIPEASAGGEIKIEINIFGKNLRKPYCHSFLLPLI